MVTKKLMPAPVKTSLSPQEVQEYKQRLLAMRSAVVDKIERMEASSLQPLAGAANELGDGATEEAGLHLELDGLAIQNALGYSAEEALDRVNAGVYGLCETCGSNIGRERLDLLPYAIECVHCARGANLHRNWSDARRA
jgi:DnaK suppressor protein